MYAWPSLDAFVEDAMRRLADHVTMGDFVEFVVPVTVGVVDEENDELGVTVAEFDEVAGPRGSHSLALSTVRFKVCMDNRYTGITQ